MTVGNYYIPKQFDKLFKAVAFENGDYHLKNIFDFTPNSHKVGSHYVNQTYLDQHFYEFDHSHLRWFASRFKHDIAEKYSRLEPKDEKQNPIFIINLYSIKTRLLKFSNLLVYLRNKIPAEIELVFFTPDIYKKENENNFTLMLEDACQNYDDYVLKNDFSKDAMSLWQVELYDQELSYYDEMGAECYFSISTMDKTNYESSITYELTGNVTKKTFDEFKYTIKPYWLHDEIEKLSNHDYLHKIIFSNGMVLQIPFKNIYIQHPME